MSRPGAAALDALLERRDLSESAAFELLISLTNPEMPAAMSGALLTALRIKGATAAEVRGFRARHALACAPAPNPGRHAGRRRRRNWRRRLQQPEPVDRHGPARCRLRHARCQAWQSFGLFALGQRGRAGGARSRAARSTSTPLPPVSNATASRSCSHRTIHPAMKAIAPVRAALGVRTVFNLLGPLVNPTQAALRADRRLEP